MKIDINVLDQTEKIIYALRTLYKGRGYVRYKMSKFEEYDLYSRNKSFLVSDEVITFTDADGRLMALKPDVTLSIIKNTRDGAGAQKLCYNENVYRASGGIRAFREIMQTGVECIGEVGKEEKREVLALAAGSLRELGRQYILEISDLELLSCFTDRLKLDREDNERLFSLIHSKNLHELKAFCTENIAKQEAVEALEQLLSVSDPPARALSKLEKICTVQDAREALNCLASILRPLMDDGLEEHIRIDFSLAGNMRYYNGIIFKGYVEGIPQSVLSGGQYDRLMQRLGRKSKAIGFAVYLDRLDRLSTETGEEEIPC